MRQSLLAFPRIQELLRGSPTFDKHENTVQQIQTLLGQLFFTEIYTEQDICASVPFLSKLPYPTPSGKDKIWDTFLILHLDTPKEQMEVDFWVRLNLPYPLFEMRDGLKKNILMLDFLDTSSGGPSRCPWEVKLVHDGETFLPNSKSPTRLQSDNLWHCTFPLSSPTAIESPSEWHASLPNEGLFVVFHGTSLPSNSWIALGALTLI